MNFNCIHESKIRIIEESIPELIMKYNVPGVSVALIDGNKDIWCKSFGVKHSLTNEPVMTNTIFEGASLTKPVIAYAALKLHEKRILELDTPLSEYLTDIYLPKEPISKIITARHILSHTCGFPNWRGKESLKVMFEPGEKFSYSGEGFVYLQKVIEQLTNKQLDQFVKDNIFHPFEMKDSSLIWINKYNNQAAYPHDENGRPKDLYKALKPNAAWSMYTTPKEYAKFILKIIHHTKVNDYCLMQQTISEMIKSQIKVNDFISWGLGWGIDSKGNTIWHWGDNGEFKAFTFFSSKDKVGIVIMTNGINGLNVCRDIICEAFGEDYIAFSKYLDII